ncbi:hypothetical protein [Ruegeria sp. HKCCA6837]|uniref:hypothetical protein n=1 Tax=Ruegeria sp. HKCCA6837 TaxID=2682989 RepID=UPI001489E002|nr:hypothetical protein [Ruegeria sp. HKCCA6837]
MSAKYLAGFVAICGLDVAGLDYHQQAKASENGLNMKGYLVRCHRVLVSQTA